MMIKRFHNVGAAVCALAVLAAPAPGEEEVEVLMEEITVEAPFDVRLELPKQSAVQTMIDRLTLRAETERAAELQIANRNAITTILDLTRYSPIPLGASENKIDAFFQQNYMRPDLNPREEKRLFDR